MAKYRVLTKSYINSTIVEAGAIVEYDGKPGSNLELVEAAEPKAEVKADAKGKVKGKAPAAPDDAAADLV
jgi:hypothetical protein